MPVDSRVDSGCCLSQMHLVAQGKHLPTMQETQVRSLGQEDPLEKEMVPNPLYKQLLTQPGLQKVIEDHILGCSSS